MPDPFAMHASIISLSDVLPPCRCMGGMAVSGVRHVGRGRYSDYPAVPGVRLPQGGSGVFLGREGFLESD